MAERPPLPGGPYLVVGLARSGVAAARALHARGETVVGVDAGRPEVDPEPFAVLALESDGLGALDGAAVLVKSPGVPQEAPVVRAARDRGIPVMGELELAWRLLQHPFVAVTGTNGKTTTVELLGHVHRTAGVPVAVAGNVGTALAGLVGALEPGAVVVAETSSFQLEDTLAFAPEAAVLLNITADHLDRHGTLAAYRQAKLRAFAHQGEDAIAVVPAGFGDVPGQAQRVTFGAGGDLRADDGTLRWRGAPLMEAGEVRLRGPHNLDNAMAAAALALARGIDPAAVREALATFAGVRHRLEEVASAGGVLYVNDSKATNVDSTAVALRSFQSGVRLILGGRGKGQDFTALRDLVAERTASVHLIGEDAEAIEAALGATGVHRDGDLDTAVEHAARLAGPGDVVLLSPACASWDQFRDFEERGDRFRALARRIAG